MNTWAVPGKQCVCIDDNWDGWLSQAMGFAGPDRVPMINEVLTISDVQSPNDDPLISLLQEQLALSFVELGHDFMFAIAHFKPLVSEEDDVKMFRAITNPAEVRAPYSEVYDG